MGMGCSSNWEENTYCHSYGSNSSLGLGGIGPEMDRNGVVAMYQTYDGNVDRLGPCVERKSAKQNVSKMFGLVGG